MKDRKHKNIYGKPATRYSKTGYYTGISTRFQNDDSLHMVYEVKYTSGHHKGMSDWVKEKPQGFISDQNIMRR